LDRAKIFAGGASSIPNHNADSKTAENC